jgi:putative peptide zinc metalloprotease protein
MALVERVAGCRHGGHILRGRASIVNLTVPPGRHVKRGEVLGYVVPSRSPVIRALVGQDEVNLVRRRTKDVSVRLLSRPLESYPGVIEAEAPGTIGRLPSEVLGAAGGGSWVADPTDPNHRRLLEGAFQFEVVAHGLEPGEALMGGRALVRFEHGAEPLGVSLARWLRQLFLRRLNV